MSNLAPSSMPPLPAKAPGGTAHRIGDIWQWLGISGDAIGTSGILRRTFLYGALATAAVVGVVVTQNVISTTHAAPRLGLLAPIIWEGSSWISLMAFFWLPWIGYRLAPPWVRPRGWLLVHLPIMALFSLAHVGGFILLRELAYRLAGSVYDFGSFTGEFLSFEFRKDALAYPLIIGAFWLIEHLLRQQQLIETPGQSLTFDIRDGARLTRVRLDAILAVASAGNYVEFVLVDGRRLLMRSPLAAVEEDLSPRGFVRTHRSWLVNGALVTALTPEGSGDYTITLPDLSVPLSRRYKGALTQLRAGG
jgi:hypothetical protein